MADLPPYAYIPGQNARHPEDWFAGIKASVTAAIPTEDLHRTEAFQTGLRYLHAGYYWECHEVLEAVWLRCPTGTPEREMTQALIQLANARLKGLMGRPRAVKRLLERVASHLAACPTEGRVLGLSRAEVSGWLAEGPQG